MIMFSVTQGVIAQLKHGDAKILIGETTSVTIANAYQRTLNQSTGVTYNWTCSSQLSITTYNRNTATIKGKTATTSGKVYFHCSYFIDGFYRTMNFYWDVVVVNNSIVYVSSVEIYPSSITLTEGSQFSLTSSVYPSNAANTTLSWSSNSPLVASVSNYGTVTAKQKGTATITCRATDGSGKYATCLVTVVKKGPTSVSLPSSLKLNMGETTKLTPTISPSTATTNYTWSSNDESIAIVDSDGNVTAVGVGAAKIVVSTANGLTAYCDVTVNYPSPTSINLTTSEMILQVGDTLELTYLLNPSNSMTTIEWNTDNPSVASVDEKGVVTAIKYGVANITVTTKNGLSDTCRVTVESAMEEPIANEFEANGISYEVIDTNANTIAVTSKEDVAGVYENSYLGEVVIPSSVIFDGKTYSVTEIADSAFYLCDELTSVSIPNSVITIGRNAFMGCSGLTSITIPNSVIAIGESAFGNCGIDTLNCYCEIPPKCGENAFVESYTAILNVPEGTSIAYANADEWCNFTNIQVTTGVEDVEIDNNSAIEVARYDINGRQLREPARGINIIKMSNGTTRKEIIK